MQCIRRYRVAALLAASLVAWPMEALAEEEWPPRLQLGDYFSLRPQGILQLDLGSTFGHSGVSGPGGGINPRRARIGVEGEIVGDIEYKLIWEFGGVPGSQNKLYQASIAYKGLGLATIIGGIFEPTFSLQQASATQNLLFLERATIVRAAAGLAADSGRVGAEARANGERWFASAALTGGQTGPGSDSSQRGAVARLAGSLVPVSDVVLHLGLSGLSSFQPPRGSSGRSVTFTQDPELALDRDFPLDTGSIRADSA